MSDALWALEPPFAVLHREGGPGVEILRGRMTHVDSIDLLPDTDSLVLVPFRQLRERGFDCIDDETPLSALCISSKQTVPLAVALRGLPRDPIPVGPGAFDLDDEAYAEVVRAVIGREIGRGVGANFVIKRSFTTTVAGWSPRAALSFFARMLATEQGAYWTFVVHTGERTLVGATPERHLSLSGGRAVMNPISGTYRYPPQGVSLPGLLEFLADGKETDELEMVVDEELKMMARICDSGIRVTGPRLRKMSRLAHTEYLIEGRTGRDARDVLRETMFAPTVTGSPLRSACSVITRHEPDGRGYYGGIAALIERDAAGAQRMDAALLIRTADVGPDGTMRICAGATLVRHSDADREAAETAAKLDGLRTALLSDATRPHPARPRADATPAESAEVAEALRRRNRRLAPFWFAGTGPVDRGGHPFPGHRCVVIDAEDDFTAMLVHQLRALGFAATIRPYGDPGTFDGQDLIVLGPGPGDPRDPLSPKMAALRHTAATLLSERRPFLAVCLGHQILCGVLGLALVRLPSPHQGRARTIRYLGADRTVGFYNTFTASSRADRLRPALTRGPVTVDRDARTGEVYGLHGSHFASMQFHPESVLSPDGLPALRQTLTRVLAAGRLLPTCSS